MKRCVPVAESFAVGFAGPDGVPDFWITPAFADERRALHLALRAPDRSAVNAVHRPAVEAGLEVLHAPREWPQYHPGYYAVFLRDPDSTTSRPSITVERSSGPTAAYAICDQTGPLDVYNARRATLILGGATPR